MDIVNWIRRKSWTVAVRDVGDLEGGAERDRRALVQLDENQISTAQIFLRRKGIPGVQRTTLAPSRRDR